MNGGKSGAKNLLLNNVFQEAVQKGHFYHIRMLVQPLENEQSKDPYYLTTFIKAVSFSNFFCCKQQQMQSSNAKVERSKHDVFDDVSISSSISNQLYKMNRESNM